MNHLRMTVCHLVSLADSYRPGIILEAEQAGVRFLVCANTLRERKINRSTLHGMGEDNLVPSGVAELARLQGMGFAYIHP